MDKEILFFVNDHEQKIITDPQRLLLEVLREDLKLTGTNFGCKEGLCGACTVLIDGEPNHSCMVTMDKVEYKWVTTIEGLADGELRVSPDRIKMVLADTALVPEDGMTAGSRTTPNNVPPVRQAAATAREILTQIAAGKPVSVRWSRADEFTWAYFRPAAVIDCKAGLDENGSIVAWEFTNINSGNSALNSPYRIPNPNEQYISSNSPLSQGAYRCLAATANNFARECFMDELAAAAGADPLEFRLKHLENQRIRAVLETAAKQFGWETKRKMNTPNTGFGLACGTEKGSVVAACVEVNVDIKLGKIEVKKVCEAFECGPIQNPENLLAQIKGCIIMDLGGALREEMKFENGKILNASFENYLVPKFKDVPELDIHLINKTDIPSAGAGETPIIAIAPAISNAIFAATGFWVRSMPMIPVMIEHSNKLNETQEAT